MRKIITILCFVLFYSSILAKSDSLVYYNIEQTYGKQVYVIRHNHTYELLNIAQSTFIEKKPGKYKGVKVLNNYYSNYYGVKELPNFFNGVYYDVLGEIIYKESHYVKFRLANEETSLLFIVPKDAINKLLSLGLVLNPEAIRNEVDFLTKRYYYLNEFKSNSALSRFPYGKELKEELKRGMILHDKYQIVIGKDYFCQLEWAGFQILDNKDCPYRVGVNVGADSYWIGCEKMSFLIKEDALVGKRELDSLRRVLDVQDSLDRIRDHQVILGIHYRDTVAVYSCDGTGYSRKYRGYCNGKEETYDNYSLRFDNSVDDAHLQRRGQEGIEIRKQVAWKYDSTATAMREQERIRKEEEARQAEEQRRLEIDSIIQMCKQKQIFIISQEYVYGDYGQFGLEWSFFNCFKKTIKYIEVTVKPYNQVDDIQRDDIGRKESKARCIGPVEVGTLATFSFDEMFWDDNDLINRLKVSYIKITFMDNTTKIYSGTENIKKRMLLYN